MNLSELVTIAALVMASLVGGGSIVLGFSRWIGRILADRYLERVKHDFRQEVESYKTKLQKSEFLFQKEFEAASQFIALYHRLIPSSQNPYVVSIGPAEAVAHKLSDVEKELEQYRRVHGAALQQEVLDRLAETIEKAGSGKHAADDPQSEQPGILDYSYRLDIAGRVMGELEAIKNELWKKVWSQSST